MHYKVKVDGKITHRALYNILGINKEGYKELLGMYISESEGANFWLSVLTDLNNRGLEDILIACTDNLKDFTEAILNIFPKAQVQKCIVHQIRNSLKYVASKDQKEFISLPQTPSFQHHYHININNNGPIFGELYFNSTPQQQAIL